jgi:hypothetical protein
MSTSYVIPNTTPQQILQTAEQIPDLLITDEGDHYLIRTPINPRYSLQKRTQLAQLTNTPPDDIQQGTNTASIRLYKTQDPDNTWFEMTAVSINHPEIILDKLAEALHTPWYSEHNETYWIYAGTDEDD